MRSNTSAKPKAQDTNALPAWASENGWDADVILSTRARLARNVNNMPFPGHASALELQSVAKQALSASKTPDKGQPHLRPVDIGKLSDTDKAALVDSHLISWQHASAGPHRWALVDDRHTVSVMVNEEDHLRLQAILPGLQLDASRTIAESLDDLFGAHLDYAYHTQYGFLTSSLGNCGTGLRMSVMAHLPGLAMSGKLPDALQAARTLGGAVRGLYGEHSNAVGDVYQISNAVSIGLSERQISARLAAAATFLSTDEQAARELLLRHRRSEIEDKITDAQGQLQSAEKLSAPQAMEILSILRLGAQMTMPTGMTNRVFNELLASMRIGTQYVSGEKAQQTFYEETRRPSLIRNKMRQGNKTPPKSSN